MRNLKSDSNLASKKGSPSDVVSCVSFTGDDSGSCKENDMDHKTVATDQGMPNPAGSYSGYDFPGYDGSFGELDDQRYYVGGDGMELQYPVMQADNGSLICFMPGFQPVYNPYNSFIPVATIGVEGQSVGQQTYAPKPMFQLPMAYPGYFLAPFPYGELVSSPYVWDPSSPIVDGPYGNGYSGVLEITGSKHNLSSANHVPPHSECFLPSDFSNPLEVKSTLASLDVPSGHGIRNQSRPVNKASQHGSMLQSDVLAKGYFPAAKFQPYNQGKGGMQYPNSPVNYKANSRCWVGTEKLKTRNKANGNGEFGLLSEQNNCPRTANVIGAVVSGGYPVGSPTDENGNSNSITSLIRRDQYNLPDFPTTYDHAFFFVIKSYSEDDVHKSIKYNVWASTPSGNKRLDTAFQDAQNSVAEKGCKCPVFLFFSVNASGQFCGVAEMVGRVDFEKSMDFWQQDKWNGYFRVKWHIIKDVPNPKLRHIILENNDNTPVTNSRDTQEVKFPHGNEILNIFKNYISKTSILDDFYFYESRQKVMQERRIKPSTPHFDNLQKVDELISRFHSVDLSCVKKIEEPARAEK